jgi:hypothetical protein
LTFPRPAIIFFLASVAVAMTVLSGCGDEKRVLGVNHAALRELSRLGDGMLVWERFREGRWQIWSQGIDGSRLRRVVPLENGRDQFCPKISPDGSRLAYLSFERGMSPYKKGQTAQLKMLDIKNKTRKTIAMAARSYAEDRAVVWFDENRFCYIDGEGFTVEHDLESGTHTRLTATPAEHFGWLVNATKTTATTGTPEFSTYDAATKSIRVQNRHAGCMPYFTQDGEWGFWIGGSGGPINRMRLSTRLTSQVIRKNDDRLHPDWRYLYFPMISPCSRLITFGASRGADDHDHFKADYEIFLGQIHPRTLELIGAPARATEWPECDRFPDVYRQELPLGTHFVEGETELEFTAPEGSEWAWDMGRAGDASGSKVRARFEDEGHHFITARSDSQELHGYVHVSGAVTPAVSAVRREGADAVVVHFSEPVARDGVRAVFADGRALDGVEVINDGVSMRARLPAGTAADSFFLEGIRDLAQRPNAMKRAEVKIPGQSWPSNRDGLVFAWADNQAESRMSDGFVCRVEPKGRAFWDEHHAMMLGGGVFEAPGAGERISEACRKTSQITVEMLLTPFSTGEDGEMHRIFTIASDTSTRNITLGQKNGRLTLWISSEDQIKSEKPQEEIALGHLHPDETHHVIVGYRQRKIEVVIDGEFYNPRLKADGGLGHWQPRKLFFGAASDGSSAWHGKIEGVAVFDRLVDDEEALEHYASSQALMGARVKNDEHPVRAKVLEVSRVPTLESITPYRNALMKFRCQVLSAEEGFTAKEIVVSQWCWLDAQPMPAQKLKPGDEVELRLQSLDNNPQVKTLVNRDHVNGELEETQYFDTSWARPVASK